MENSKEYYIALLRAVAERENRLPRKSDFTQDDVNRIKGIFGPWPWALEAAKLKESKEEARKARNREKHLRARERRKQQKSARSEAEDERKCL